MKPDAGKQRDKARLAGKKAKKAAAKASRKAADELATPAQIAELEHHIKTRRGSNRRTAFDELVAVDVDRARTIVRALARDADGKNLQELGALSVRSGEAKVVDDVVRGRFGDVAVWEHAPAAVPDAIERLRLALPLPLDDLERRLRALGVVPMQAAAREAKGAGALLCAVLDALAQDASLRRLVCDALLEADPAALWARRELATPEQAALAALASDTAMPDAREIDALVAWWSTLTPSVRADRMRTARLPSSAARLAIPQRVALLRAVLLEPTMSAEAREVAARGLAMVGTPEASAALFVEPEASVSATLSACERLDFDEAWSIVEPMFTRREDVRDAFLQSSHARNPRMLDTALALLPIDPIGGAAFLVRIGSRRAREELEGAFDVCSLTEARRLFHGVVARALSATVRRALEAGSLPLALASTDGGPRPDLTLAALRALLPRAGMMRTEVTASIARLEARARV